MMTPRVVERDHARWLNDVLSAQPDRLAGELRRRYEADSRTYGRKAANIALVDHVHRYRGRIPNDADDDELKRWADHYAGEVRRGIAAAPGDDPMLDYAIGRQICSGANIEPPRPENPDVYEELIGCVARMRCQYWWRRKIRVALGRRVEQSARAAGLVRSRAAPYVSDDGFRRWNERQQANRQTLADTVAECDQTGETMVMLDIAAAGVSNPTVRRSELMARMRGVEEVAKARGHVALFVTWTAPPELHATKGTGEVGEGRHVTPREAQAWLNRSWRRCRSALHRRHLTTYGMRVAEPHKDGTPHWHILVFVPPAQAPDIEAVLKHYVIDGGDYCPIGKARRDRIAYGWDCKQLEPGMATGYVAKYVAKAIDGFGVDVPTTRDAYGRQTALDLDPGEAANRVRAWASQWGIRQFQPIGQPPVTVWRELRRLDAPDTTTVQYQTRVAADATEKDREQLRHAADAGDWCRYVELMGGPCVPRKDRPARVRYVVDANPGRYGEKTFRPYVEAWGRVVWTRARSWTITYRPQAEPTPESAGPRDSAPGFFAGGVSRAPWTRGNNCTHAGEGSDEHQDTATYCAAQSARGGPRPHDGGTGRRGARDNPPFNPRDRGTGAPH